MTNVLIAILLLYNMWLVFYLLHERKQEKRTGQPEPPSKQKQPENDTNIVGKSLFQMPKGRTSGDTAVPQAAIPAEGEAVEMDDITFADEMPSQRGQNGNKFTGMPSAAGIQRNKTGEQPSMRVPADKLEDAFSDTRLSDVPVEYEDGDDEPTGEYASGATIEEMNEAIRTADNPKATDTEKRKAGEVFHEMAGNELYEILTAKMPGIISKIRGLIDLYESKPTVSSGGNKEVVPISSRNIPAVEGLDDFDIRDFV